MHDAYKILIIAWAFVFLWVTPIIFFQRKHHPAALFILFFSELWERFSFYGMRALLTLYIVHELLWGDSRAYEIYGAYGALVYATPILGGYLAEKYLGYRKAIFWGGILMMLGHFTLAIPHEIAFFTALALLIMGNGFFKPNVSSFVGEFYGIKDPRRDEAFTLFYMGINVGAFLAPLTAGAIGEIEGWHYGFGLAGIGMFIGLLFFAWGHYKGIFKDKGLPPEAVREKPYDMWIYIGSVLLLIPIAFLVNLGEFTGQMVIAVGIFGVLSLLYIALKSDKIQREKLFVLIILFVFTALFWSFFEQAGSSINLFTNRNVDRTLLGFTIPTTAFQSVNPLFIILLAPLFTMLWDRLSRANIDPPAPYKFALGLLQLGAGFLILGFSKHFASPEGLVPLLFLIGAYFLHTTGELCLSPIGLSLVTKLSPAKLVGFVMGVWFISSAVAHAMGMFIAKLTAIDVHAGTETVSLIDSLSIYSEVFTQVGLIAVGSAILLFILSPILTKWMHGIR